MNMLVSTTESVDCKIKEYLGIVSAHIVLGTNLFSDFSASISDSFGGESGTYTRRLESISDVVIDRIKRKAAFCAADAVVGVRICFSEISGKGKGMLMASATGTAVRLEKNLDKKEVLERQVPKEIVKTKIRMRELLSKMEIGIDSLTEDEWVFITENHCDSVTEELFESMITYCKTKTMSQELNTRLLVYLDHSNKRIFINRLYDEFVSKRISESDVFSLIRMLDLMCPEMMFKNIEHISDMKGVLFVLSKCDKDYYEESDILAFKNILNYIDKNKASGELKTSKSMFGKETQYYVCPNGHKIPEGKEYCGDMMCMQNVHGFTKEDNNMIDIIKTKIETLEGCFV